MTPALPPLNSKQKRTLRDWRFGQKVEHRLRLRTFIFWALFWEGLPVNEVANRYSVSDKTVRRWRDRFAYEGVEGLYVRPRSGAPLKFGG